MNIYHIDYETKSAADLRAVGFYRYAEHPTTDILCMAYAKNNEDVQLWTPDQPWPEELNNHIEARLPIYAHNAQFERLITQNISVPRYGCAVVLDEQWFCTAAMAAAMALPRSLEGLGVALGLPIQKDMSGRRLMLQMSKPRKHNPDGTYEWWTDLKITGKSEKLRLKQIEQHEDRLSRLYDYCKRDVESERLAEKKLYPLSDAERSIYLLDQRMNDRGIVADVDTVIASVRVVEGVIDRLNKELADITNGVVTALTQRDKIVEWICAQGYNIDSIDKQGVGNALADDSLPATVRRVLEIRQEGAKSSTAKLEAILRQARQGDNRIQGNLLYHGASTGRWAGKGVQLQNLKRPDLEEPETAIPYLQTGNFELVEITFGPPMAVVADCIRSMLTAGPGKVFFAADFAAIEARVTAWLAGQQDLLDEFKTGADVYSSFASTIYKRKINKKDNPKERQLGKAGILGLGFQMGAAKFVATCLKDGIEISEEEAVKVVKLYRRKYSKIAAYWYGIEKAALSAVKNPDRTIVFGKLKFRMRDGNLRMMLPSGRVLNYPEAKAVNHPTPWGETRNVVEISAVNAITKKWERAVVTPGTWTENAVQAVARDLMAEALLRVEAAGYPPVLTVHDEAVSEVDDGFGSVKEYEDLVAETPAWAEGLPVKAEGWRGFRYRK